jgi:peptide/nickel transport system permease protein
MLRTRLIRLIVVVYGVATLLFFVERISGDPAEYVLFGAPVTEETVKEFRATLGLEDPLWQQYTRYLKNVTTANFGDSFRLHRPALTVILERLPKTAQLAFAAAALAALIGIPIGVLAAVNRGSMLDVIVIGFLQIGQALPNFALALILVYVFGVQLRLLPVAGFQGWQHLILPAFALAIPFSAVIARLTRSTLIDVLHQDYIRTARAKGLRSGRVYVFHGLRNAAIPIVTLSGLQLGGLLGGAVIVETIFLWPGVGTAIITAVNARDYTVTEAGVFVLALMFVLVNLVIDLSYWALDPRMRGKT